MYLRRFRLSLEETKAYFDCVNCSCRNKMSYELARWRASNKFQGFLMVSDLRSCTMLSTLPLFYIAQSVNSDDRRARFQGLRVIMSAHHMAYLCLVFLLISPENAQCFDVNGSFPVSRCCCVLSGLCLLIIPFIFLYLFKTFENNPKIPKHLLYQ